jgi:hypothetical protein
MLGRWTALLAFLALACPACDPGEQPAEDADVDAPLECETDEDCRDAHDCTTERCQDRGCRYETDPAPCDDGDPCNGAERCDAVRGCTEGEPVACDDGINCTRDECLPESGRCLAEPDDSLCEEGYVCDLTLEGCIPSE